MADSIVSKDSSNYARGTVLRRFIAQPPVDFYVAPAFKCCEPDGTLAYRQLVVPTPFACLAEAVVLSELGQSAAFGKHPSTYSYLWPKSGALGSNFEHYFDGYQRRNAAIVERLFSRADRVALIIDIKSFYPSISKERAQDVLLERLRRSDVADEVKKAAQVFTEAAISFSSGSVGIPIGPEISHLLADLFLRDLDIELFRVYANDYFRYVDDIVLVLAHDAVDSALEHVTRLLETQGLSINIDKVDVVSASDWGRHGPTGLEEVEEHTFEAMVFRMKTYIATKPERLKELEDALQAEGFYLPVRRFRDNAVKPSFLDMLVALSHADWPVLQATYTDTTASLVKYAKGVRRLGLEDFDKTLNVAGEMSPTVRKWTAQKLRRRINQFLYLRDRFTTLI